MFSLKNVKFSPKKNSLECVSKKKSESSNKNRLINEDTISSLFPTRSKTNSRSDSASALIFNAPNKNFEKKKFFENFFYFFSLLFC